jgi:hypothetical protein
VVVGAAAIGLRRSNSPNCPRSGCLTILGAWLRKQFDVSHSQCCIAETSASQIGSRVVRPIYIQLSKNWWERLGEIHREPGHRMNFGLCRSATQG